MIKKKEKECIRGNVILAENADYRFNQRSYSLYYRHNDGRYSFDYGLQDI